jgi:hypothetical protein
LLLAGFGLRGIGAGMTQCRHPALLDTVERRFQLSGRFGCGQRRRIQRIERVQQGHEGLA